VIKQKVLMPYIARRLQGWGCEDAVVYGHESFLSWCHRQTGSRAQLSAEIGLTALSLIDRSHALSTDLQCDTANVRHFIPTRGAGSESLQQNPATVPTLPPR